MVKAKYRTYGQFRGYWHGDHLYRQTASTTRRPRQVTTYYHGMSDDNNSTAVTLTDSQGGTHDDANALAGLSLETTAYHGEGGPVDHSTDHLVLGVGGDRVPGPAAGCLTLTANMVHPAETWTRQALTDGGATSWRVTETDTTYDATTSDAYFGLPSYVYSHTVPGQPGLRPVHRHQLRAGQHQRRTWSACPPRPRPTRSPAAGSLKAPRPASRPG